MHEECLQTFMVQYLMPYKLIVSALSDIGNVRQNNEDFWASLQNDQFFVLADGMGGHQAGEVAAAEAVSLMCGLFKEKNSGPKKSLQQAKEMVKEIIQEVNRLIYFMSCHHEDLTGMGTTLCCIYLHPEGLVCGHVGDSRIYLLRQQKLKQLTQDHSLLRELIDLGKLDEKEALGFQHKNIITKAIGTEPFVEPSVKTDVLLPDDTLLMCTDGLTDMLSHEDIQRIMRYSPDQDTAQNLIEAAKQKGGYDNVTAVVVKIQEKYESMDLS